MNDSIAQRVMQWLSSQRAGPLVPMSSGGVPIAHGAAFNPEGAGYDYETARAAGLMPGADGHWPSRDPRTGMLLKGRQHRTFHKTEAGERAADHGIFQGDGKRYFSAPSSRDGGY